MTIEELVDSYLKAEGAIQELEAQKKVVRDAILEDMIKMDLTGLKTKTGYNVARIKRAIFSEVPMSQAGELGAIKVKKVVDGKILLKLMAKGVKIKGVKHIEYIKIKEAD